MHRTAVLGLLAVGLPALIGAQPAPSGRLGLLASPAAGATCVSSPASAALRHSGIARSLDVQEPGRPRLLSLGITAAREPRMLLIMMSAPVDGSRRREGESITVFFDANGAVVRGNRSAYTTGTPARRDEDRHLSLLAADSASARVMAAALVRLCRP